ncbi:MAG: hypothetical protein R2862_10850 [Thermoanaerobaculia bacterium]
MLLTAEGEVSSSPTCRWRSTATRPSSSLPVELGDDAVRFLAASKTFYTPTLIVSYGGPWGELYYWQTRNPHDDRSSTASRAALRPLDNWGRRHPPGSIRSSLLDSRWSPKGWRRWIAPAATGLARCARPAAGTRRPLGALDDGRRRRSRSKAMTPHAAWRAATAGSADKLGLLPDLGGTVERQARRSPGPRRRSLAGFGHNGEKIRWVIKNGRSLRSGRDEACGRRSPSRRSGTGRSSGRNGSARDNALAGR